MIRHRGWLRWRSMADRASLRSRPVYQGSRTKIGKRVFQARERAVKRPHLLIGHVLHREHDPFFSRTKRGDSMPQRVAVKNHEGPRIKRDGLFADFPCRSELTQVSHKSALFRSFD